MRNRYSQKDEGQASHEYPLAKSLRESVHQARQQFAIIRARNSEQANGVECERAIGGGACQKGQAHDDPLQVPSMVVRVQNGLNQPPDDKTEQACHKDSHQNRAEGLGQESDKGAFGSLAAACADGRENGKERYDAIDDAA